VHKLADWFTENPAEEFDTSLIDSVHDSSDDVRRKMGDLAA
jgi:hypothetical protein